MTNQSLTKQSLTDWARVNYNYDNNVPIPYDPNDPDDGPYDPNDEAAVEAFFATAVRVQRGVQKAPLKKPVTLRLSQDTLDKLRASGKGWQTRVDQHLTAWVQHLELKA